jgi:penicillin-binding protein 1B
MTALFAGAVLAAVLLAAAFLYIDHSVARQLQARQSSAVPAVYAQPFHAVSGELAAEELRNELALRSYRAAPGNALHPGEFRDTGGEIEIMTREYQLPDGSTAPSQTVQFDSGANIIHAPGQSNALSLEPVVLARLGAGGASTDLKASRYVGLPGIPSFVRQAVIGIEDERFYRHFGIDLEGIARALLQNVRAMGIVQGGSTLTQQLAKNIFFSPQRTLGRKVREALAAVSLERRLSKDQILEMYLNEVYLGQEGPVAVHGFPEAARDFFGKDIKELSLSEAALLAGVIRAPSYYSPRRHLQRAVERRDVVLEKMRELGSISQKDFDKARAEKVQVREAPEYGRNAPYFLSALTKTLGEQINLDAAALSGLSIYTGIEPAFQSCAEKAISAGLARLEKDYPALRRKDNPLEAALVSIEPFSGKVRAWVGGRDFGQSQYDRVSLARRQIGSTVKPFLYLTALDASLNSYKVATPISVLSDRPISVDLVTHNQWEPENYDHQYHGDVTLRYALENSLNLPAVYVSQRVGIPAVASTIRRFRLAADVPEVPSLALGAADTTLLDLTAAYGALANGGSYVTPRLYVSALDASGGRLAAPPALEERVADENAVFVLTNILQGVVERGTAKAIRRLGYQGVAAGKTGTSNDSRDAWFVGYSPDLVTGVWVGFDDNAKTGLTGGSAAAPIWAGFQQCLATRHHALPFVAPQGVVFADIDLASGELSGKSCPSESTVREVFVRGTEPRGYCRIHNAYPEDVVPPELVNRVDQRPERKKSFWKLLFGE